MAFMSFCFIKNIQIPFFKVKTKYLYKIIYSPPRAYA